MTVLTVQICPEDAQLGLLWLILHDGEIGAMKSVIGTSTLVLALQRVSELRRPARRAALTV